LPLPTPTQDQARDWLKAQGVASPDDWLAAAGGAPILAAKLMANQTAACPDWLGGLLRGMGQSASPDLGTLADAISKQPAIDWIDPLHRLCVDLMLASHGIAVRYYPALAAQSTSIARLADGVALTELARYVQQQRRVAGHPLAAKLFAHAVLQRVVTACRPVRSLSAPYQPPG
jgi:DNA polymerase-3 subunit delta'